MLSFKKIKVFFLSVVVGCLPLSVNAQNINSDKSTYQITENVQNDSQIKVDCMFSVGKACRPSHYLRKYNLRFQAAPLDWMMSYSLDTVLHLFETKFKDFFEEIEVVPNEFCGNHRVVKDTKNGITSIHHFRKDVDINEEHKKVREMMLNRGKKVDEILNNSSSIGLICDRGQTTKEELIDFIKKFGKLYPNKKICLINVVNSNISEIKRETLFEDENLKVIQFTFKDLPPVNDEKNHPKWQGNYEAWDTVINSFKVNEKNLENAKNVEF